MRPAKKLQRPIESSHVVILTNYMRKHHMLVFEEIKKRVGKLTVLLSTNMEPDRDWQAEWGDLDVIIQKNWMYTAKWKHSAGFRESNFIHIPIDTVSQLKTLQPDIVFSYEMGMRTFFSGRYCKSANIPMVMVGNMSEHIERERGPLRRMLRKFIKRSIDFATYNGPSCKRYLESLNIPEERLFHFPYAYDPSKTYTGPKTFSDGDERRLLFCGALGQRKGILNFVEVLQRYAREIPGSKIRLSIAGDGPLKAQVAEFAQPNLVIEFLGNCTAEQLCDSMAAQSIEAVGEEGQNGWFFDPNDSNSIYEGIERAFATTPARLAEMSELARASVEWISPKSSSEGFFDMIGAISLGHAQSDSSIHSTERSFAR